VRPDFERMKALVREVFASHGLPMVCTPCDLDWWLCQDGPESLELTRLWENAQGELVAWAWPVGDQGDLLIRPASRHLYAEILDWWEKRDGAHVRAWAFQGDQDVEALLARRGYTPTERVLHIRAADATQDQTEPSLAEGYTLRHVAGPDDLLRYAAAHGAIFGHNHHTVDLHQRITTAPSYRPELDLVVEAPDGSFAAFALFWLDSASGLSLVEPVGCHPDHRRKGLTSSILREGLRRLASLGGRKAVVTAWHHEVAPGQLYESVGFRTVGLNRAWKKPLA